MRSKLSLIICLFTISTTSCIKSGDNKDSNNADSDHDSADSDHDSADSDHDNDGYRSDIDCDDNNADVYPSQIEVCLDGIDNDCDGLTDWCGAGDADVILTGNIADSGTGSRIVGGDINGDGLGDLAISAPGAEGKGTYNTQYVYIVYGSESLASKSLAAANATLENDGYMNTFGFGADVVSTDRGYAYLAIGDGWADPNNNGREEGRTHLIHGNNFSTGSTNIGNIASAQYDGSADSEYSGVHVVGIEDINGDGTEDLLIGAFGNEEGTGSLAGAAYVVLSQNGSFSDFESLADVGYVLRGTDAGDQAGRVVANGGWLDDSDSPYLLVGAPQAASSAGVVYVVRADDAIAEDAQSLDIFPSIEGSAGEQIGAALDGGCDLNGDGWDDFVVGAPTNDAGGADAGAVYIVSGGTFPLAADITIYGSKKDAVTGSAVACGGDVNGDGLDDLLIGSPGYDSDDGGNRVGAAHLFLGREDWGAQPLTLSDADATYIGINNRADLGSAVALVPDLNGDGLDDIVFGAPLTDNTNANQVGAAYVFFSQF